MYCSRNFWGSVQFDSHNMVWKSRQTSEDTFPFGKSIKEDILFWVRLMCALFLDQFLCDRESELFFGSVFLPFVFKEGDEPIGTAQPPFYLFVGGQMGWYLIVDSNSVRKC